MNRSLRRRAAPVLAVVLLVLVPALAHAADAEYLNQMRSARRYLGNGQPEAAERIFQQVLKRHPSDLEASIGYTDALLGQKKLDEAEAFLADALGRPDAPPELLRARVRLRRAQDRLPEAYADALQVLERSPDLEMWAVRETQDLLQAGLDPRTAVRAAQEALDRHPDQIPLLVARAVLEPLRNHPEEGQKLVIRAEEEHALGGSALLRYADHLQALGLDAPCLTALLAAVERTDKAPRRSEILFRVAEMQERTGDVRGALASLERISTERPGTGTGGRALLESARLYQEYLDDPAGALRVYERLKDDPMIGHHRPDMLLMMADCYVRLDRLPEAAAVYRLVPAEAFDPEDAEEAAFMTAEVEFFRGEADSARALYQTMAEAYPRSLRADDAAGRYVLLNKYQALGGGEAVAILGRLDWARHVKNGAAVDSTAQLLIDRYPGGELAAEAYLARAEIAESRGDHAAALAHLDAIVSGMPTERRRAEALSRQAAILLAMGRTADALGKLETLLADHPGSILAGDARRQVEALRREIKS